MTRPTHLTRCPFTGRRGSTARTGMLSRQVNAGPRGRRGIGARLHDLLVEVLVLGVGDVALAARPQGCGLVHRLPLVGLDLLRLLLVPGLLLHQDRQRDVVAVLADDGLQLPGAEELGLLVAQVQDDVGAAGGAGDVSWTLGQLLARPEFSDGAINVVHASIFDPAAVAQAVAAGVGATVTLEVGGRVDPGPSGPVTITGEVFSFELLGDATTVTLRLADQFVTAKAGKTFRPSDWSERLAGALSSFRPKGSGIGAHIGYSPFCVPRVIDGIKCVIVNEALRDIEPMAWDFVMHFARDNDLQVVEACP